MRAARRMAAGEGGQAAVELVALALVVALALGALGAVAPVADGRSVGGFLAHHLVCAATGHCHPAERELARAYGERDAALVRSLAPNLAYEPGERQLPVDPRGCRRPACAWAPDEGRLDAHHAGAGAGSGGGRATAFTRLIRRGARTYVQYWLYYPDSNTTLAGSDDLWRRVFGEALEYPGYHRDDWESIHVRIEPDGARRQRVSSHGGHAPCESACLDGWDIATGWVRVSRGSHAGHVAVRTLGPRGRPGSPLRIRRIPLVPGRNVEERSTTGEGLRLIPLETLDKRGYRRLDEAVAPPWEKEAYRDPESGRS